MGRPLPKARNIFEALDKASVQTWPSDQEEPEYRVSYELDGEQIIAIGRTKEDARGRLLAMVRSRLQKKQDEATTPAELDAATLALAGLPSSIIHPSKAFTEPIIFADPGGHPFDLITDVRDGSKHARWHEPDGESFYADGPTAAAGILKLAELIHLKRPDGRSVKEIRKMLLAGHEAMRSVTLAGIHLANHAVPAVWPPPGSFQLAAAIAGEFNRVERIDSWRGESGEFFTRAVDSNGREYVAQAASQELAYETARQMIEQPEAELHPNCRCMVNGIELPDVSQDDLQMSELQALPPYVSKASLVMKDGSEVEMENARIFFAPEPKLPAPPEPPRGKWVKREEEKPRRAIALGGFK